MNETINAIAKHLQLESDDPSLAIVGATARDTQELGAVVDIWISRNRAGAFSNSRQ
jgi:hypothetical protein